MTDALDRDNPWQNADFAARYAKDALDPTSGWYEHTMNAPSLINLIPISANSILDFGCGPGDFTNRLAKTHKDVDGCDSSKAMLDIARHNYSDTRFFLWDFKKPFPLINTKYDVVISKLALQFVDELDVFAKAVGTILQPSDSIVFSVPHPAYTAKQVENYWGEAKYQQQIRKFGIYDTMIHRSLAQYITIFTRQGFALTGLDEPEASIPIVTSHNADPEGFRVPNGLMYDSKRYETKAPGSEDRYASLARQF